MFHCKNTSCSISTSKASFPILMNCPVCEEMLAEELAVDEKETTTFSEEQKKLISSLPYVIAQPLSSTLKEQSYWTKINLLKDTFLNYLKYLGLLAASEFFESSVNDKGMVQSFFKNLSHPSFGSWNAYIRESLQFLNENNHQFFIPELPLYYSKIETGKKRKLYTLKSETVDQLGEIQYTKGKTTSIGMLINFRNKYLGHGLTLNESKSKALWETYWPIFESLLQQLEFPEHYPMLKKDGSSFYKLQGEEINIIEHKGKSVNENVWIENKQGEPMSLVPFFITPGEFDLANNGEYRIYTYESYNDKSLKFFAPEGDDRSTSGRILGKLQLLLKNKEKEKTYTPEEFTKDVLNKQIQEENAYVINTLKDEKKIIEGIYQHREDIEIKLREWIGSIYSIFFIGAEAGSGKTNLLVNIIEQYSKRNVQSLFIRAGRMVKTSLEEEIAYLLNLSGDNKLKEFKNLPGTQQEPLMILIDGLNEASNPKEVWKSILNICKIFPNGKVKFVVTNRTSSKLDTNTYNTTAKQLDWFYTEKNESAELYEKLFWLTPLNMLEMEGLWNVLTAKNKVANKPQFTFNDIATYDRSIYDKISNPLTMRIFLETNHGKSLPKKGKKRIHIWRDWFAHFSKQEQEFLHLLAVKVWEEDKNELSISDLLEDKNLATVLESDLVSSPYRTLQTKGWISRYVRDLNIYIGFTVEELLHYILGLYLEKQQPSVEDIQKLVKTTSKLKLGAIESYLTELTQNGELKMISELIDKGNEGIDIVVMPLVIYTQEFGAEKLINELLQDETENDWKVLYDVLEKLDGFSLTQINKEFLLFGSKKLIKDNWYHKKVLFCLSVVESMDRVRGEEFLDTIIEFLVGSSLQISMLDVDDLITNDKNGKNPEDSATELFSLAEIYEKWSYYDKSLAYYEKAISIRLKVHGEEHPYVANCYHNIGRIWSIKRENEKALEYYEKALNIRLKINGEEHLDIAKSYNNIGNVWRVKGKIDKGLEYYMKSLEIKLKVHGKEHHSVANTYINIGVAYKRKGEYDKELEFYKRSLEISLKVHGEEHPSVAIVYNNIGLVYKRKGEYDKEFEYYKRSLEIRLKVHGEEHPSVAIVYNNIGLVYKRKGEYDKELEYYKRALEIRLKVYGEEHPSVANSYNNIGVAYKRKGEYDKGLEYHKKSLEIFLKVHGEEHPSVATTYNNIGLVYEVKGEYDKAIEYYKLVFDIDKKGGIMVNIALCYEKFNDKTNAYVYFLESAELRKGTIGLEDEKTKESIKETLRLAKELGKEDELPEWIKVRKFNKVE